MIAGGVEKLLKEGNYKTIETTNLRVQPGSLVIDGAGNFFGIEQIDANEGLVGAVYEVLAAGGYKTSKIIVSGLGSDSMSLAVDGSGNLFVADNDAIAVTELLSAGDYTTSKSLGSGLDSPTSVAVDSSGNVFVADYGHNLTKEILAEGGYTTVKTLGGGPTYSYLIAIDAADNVYFTGDNGIDFVLSEILAAGGYTTIKTLSTNFVEPSTLAVDSTGNIFVTSEYNTELGETEYAATSELVRSQPPASLTFLNTPIGHTSSDSPKSVQFQNVGNATLKGTGNLLDDTNFTVVPGSGLVPDCTAGTLSLTAGAICNLSFDFTPGSSGLLTTELTLTDNSRNATDATQSLILSGTGASTAAIAKVSPSSLNFGSLAYPGSATKTLTVTNIGTGTLAVLPSSNGPGTVITGNNCGDGVGAGKSCELQIEFKPDHLGMNHNTVTIGTNTATNPTVYVHGTATGVGSLTTLIQFGTDFGRNARTQPLTVTNYGVPGTVTVATQSGTTPFSVISNGCTAGITDGNSCTIEVQYLPTQSGSVKGYLELVPSIGAKQVIGMEGNEY